jgi:hypothetical protein
MVGAPHQRLGEWDAEGGHVVLRGGRVGHLSDYCTQAPVPDSST